MYRHYIIYMFTFLICGAAFAKHIYIYMYIYVSTHCKCLVRRVDYCKLYTAFACQRGMTQPNKHICDIHRRFPHTNTYTLYRDREFVLTWLYWSYIAIFMLAMDLTECVTRPRPPRCVCMCVFVCVILLLCRRCLMRNK